MKSEIEIHPFAKAFPVITGEAYMDLVADIRQQGLREPIVNHEEMILEGQNRYAACKEAKVDPRFTDYEGSDPLGYVISKNIMRRHLTPQQRAEIVLKLQGEEFKKVAAEAKTEGQKKGSKAPKKASTSHEVKPKTKTKTKPKDVTQQLADKAKVSRSTADRVIKKSKPQDGLAAPKTSKPTEPQKGPRKISEEKLSPKVSKWCESHFPKFLADFQPGQLGLVIDTIIDDLEARREKLEPNNEAT
jgi:hypothetical protein